MANITHEGIVTIACSWTFTLLALLSLWAVRLARRRKTNNASLDDLLVYFSFLCSFLLTSITTWAILREGLYQHLSSISYSEAELIAKVSGQMTLLVSVTESLVVARCKRSAVVTHQHLFSGRCLLL